MHIERLAAAGQGSCGKHIRHIELEVEKRECYRTLVQLFRKTFS